MAKYACGVCAERFESKNEIDKETGILMNVNKCPKCGRIPDKLMDRVLFLKKENGNKAIVALLGCVIVVIGFVIATSKAEVNNDSANVGNSVNLARDSDQGKDEFESQFSQWDGSHFELEKYVKNNLNDASSYEHVETKHWIYSDHMMVNMSFRAKNSFGALVLQTLKAKVFRSGKIEIIEII